MRTFILFLNCLLILGFTRINNDKKLVSQADMKQVNFDWLLGTWQRSNEKEGKQTYEYWQKISDVEYGGLGCTLQSGDTIWQEKMLLRKVGKGWNFEVSEKNDALPTIFVLSKITKEGFVCENPYNEFPQRIAYQRHDKGMTAQISGGGPDISFEFVQLDK